MPGSASGLLARLVGDKKAKEIWFLCRQYTAAEAMAMNLVNKVVPLADLEAEGVQWADEILEMSPTAIRFLKSSFLVATDGLAGLQEFAGNATGLYYTTDEAHEGSTAFLEKRRPTTASTRAAHEHDRRRAGRARPSGFRIWIVAARPATLPAAVAGVLVGLGAALAVGTPFRARHRARLHRRRAAAPGRGQLRQRPVRLPARRRHAGRAAGRCGSRRRGS